MDIFSKTIKQIYNMDCTPEFKFHPQRKWRIDYAIDPDHARIAIEVEGGTWIHGRHIRPTGYLKDIEKYNALSALGWRLIRVTPDKLMTLDTLKLINDLINGNENRKP